jgi:hypothetical protein
MHSEDGRQVSQTVVESCPMEPERMQYEELAVKHVASLRERSKELASPLLRKLMSMTWK